MAEYHLNLTATSEKDRLITPNIFQSDNQSSSRYDHRCYFSPMMEIFLIKNKYNPRKLISHKGKLLVGNPLWLKYTNVTTIYYLYQIFGITHIYRR